MILLFKIDFIHSNKKEKKMADKKLGLKDTLKLAPKIDLKKNEPDIAAMEKQVQRIHDEPVATKVATIIEEESLEQAARRITLDVPFELYKEMKMKVFGEGVTLKKYILGLVAQDLKK